MNQNALIESPTGTGKTLCLLCAALAWKSAYQEFKKAARNPDLSLDVGLLKRLHLSAFGNAPFDQNRSSIANKVTRIVENLGSITHRYVLIESLSCPEMDSNRLEDAFTVIQRSFTN